MAFGWLLSLGNRVRKEPDGAVGSPAGMGEGQPSSGLCSLLRVKD